MQNPPGEGMTGQKWQDERLAPPVDEELLRALVRRELSTEEAREVYRRIHSFRSWSEAHARILVKEFRDQNQSDQTR